MIRLDNYYYVFKKYDLGYNEVKEEEEYYDKDSIYNVFESSWENYSEQDSCDGQDMNKFLNRSHEIWYKIFEFFGYIDNEENYKYWVYNYIYGHPTMNSYQIYRIFKNDNGKKLYYMEKEIERIKKVHQKTIENIQRNKSIVEKYIQMEVEDRDYKKIDKIYDEIEEIEEESIECPEFEIFIESVDNRIHKIDYIHIYKGKVAEVLVIHCHDLKCIEFHKTETGIYTSTYIYQGVREPTIKEWKLITAFEPLMN